MNFGTMICLIQFQEKMHNKRARKKLERINMYNIFEYTASVLNR